MLKRRAEVRHGGGGRMTRAILGLLLAVALVGCARPAEPAWAAPMREGRIVRLGAQGPTTPAAHPSDREPAPNLTVLGAD